MPSVDELLDAAQVAEATLTETNDKIEIDADTRTMIIPDTERIFGVMSDEKGERKYFRCKRFVGNGIDLSKLSLRIVFQNASGLETGKDKYIVTDLATDGEDYITFSWELSRKVTAYKGIISFIVCAIKTKSDGTIINEWNTTIANGAVLDGLEVNGTQEQEEVAKDYYNQLEAELLKVANEQKAEIGKKAQDVIATIPSDYAKLQSDVNGLREELSDYSSSAVGIKNFMPYPYARNDITVNGVTFKMDGRKITIKGQPTNTVDLAFYGMFKVTDNNILEPGQTYYLSGVDRYISLAFYDSSEVLLSIVNINGVSEFMGIKKFTVPSNATGLYIYWYCNNTSKIFDYSIFPRIYTVENSAMDKIDKLKEDKVDNSDVTYNLSAMLEPFTQKQEITGTWDDNYTGYIDKDNGNVVSYDQMRMVSLQVKEHEIYDIKSRVGYRMALWSIHDSSGNIIKIWENSNISLPFDYYEDIGVVIPKSGAELRVYAYVGHLSSYIRRYIAKFHVDSPLKGKKWCAIGDSLTDSATLNGDKNYVDFITDKTGVISVNKGIGGTGYLNNNNGADTTFYERRSDFPKDADIYTFFGSFNDMNLFDDNSIGDIESNDNTTLMGAMSLAIRSIGYINKNAVVGVILPTPWASYNGTTLSKSVKSEKYIKALIDTCNKYSVPYLDLYHQSGLRPWDVNFNKIYYKDDNGDGNYSEGVHPNSFGHEKFIAPKIKLFLESLIN